MMITRREKNLIFILIILVLGFAFMRLYYLPQQKELQALVDQQQQLLGEKAILTEQKQTPEALAQKKDAWEVQYKKLATQVPDQPQLTELLRFIHATCQTNGLPLLGLTYDQKENPKKGEPSQINFRLHTTGTVTDLTVLLQNMTAGDRLIKINQAVSTAVKNPPEEREPEAYPQYQPEQETAAQPGVSVYYIPPPEIPVSLGQRLPQPSQPVAPAPRAEPEPKPKTESKPEQKKSEQIMKGFFDLDLQITAYHLNQPNADADKTKPKQQ